MRTALETRSLQERGHCRAESVPQARHRADCAGPQGRTLPRYTGVFQKYMLGTGLFTHGTIYQRIGLPRHGRDVRRSRCGLLRPYPFPCIALARNSRRTIGINVGTLESLRLNNFAKARRKTLSWGQAIAYGEYCDYRHPAKPLHRPARIDRATLASCRTAQRHHRQTYAELETHRRGHPAPQGMAYRRADPGRNSA